MEASSIRPVSCTSAYSNPDELNMLDGIGTIGTTKYSYEAPLSIRVVEVVVFRGMETTTSLVPASDGATPSVLLKTDVLGRVKHGPGQRERILDRKSVV